MPEKPPVVLTIAGFDPSSGAGVTADIKTIAAHSCYGVACITALTVQSTAGVKRVEMVDSALIAESLEELAEDLDISAVHIGMLGSGKVVKVVADFLSGATTKGSSNRPGRRGCQISCWIRSSSRPRERRCWMRLEPSC